MEEGAAMESPLSAVVANLYMESFEEQVVTSSPLKPTCRIWKHYIDDTYLVAHDSVESFLQHLNHKQPSICFIMETENYNKLTLLNTTGTREPGGCLTSSVYRKPTHAYQYSAYDSNH